VRRLPGYLPIKGHLIINETYSEIAGRYLVATPTGAWRKLGEPSGYSLVHSPDVGWLWKREGDRLRLVDLTNGERIAIKTPDLKGQTLHDVVYIRGTLFLVTDRGWGVEAGGVPPAFRETADGVPVLRLNKYEVVCWRNYGDRDEFRLTNLKTGSEHVVLLASGISMWSFDDQRQRLYGLTDRLERLKRWSWSGTGFVKVDTGPLPWDRFDAHCDGFLVIPGTDWVVYVMQQYQRSNFLRFESSWNKPYAFEAGGHSRAVAFPCPVESLVEIMGWIPEIHEGRSSFDPIRSLSSPSDTMATH